MSPAAAETQTSRVSLASRPAPWFRDLTPPVWGTSPDARHPLHLAGSISVPRAPCAQPSAADANGPGLPAGWDASDKFVARVLRILTPPGFTRGDMTRLANTLRSVHDAPMRRLLKAIAGAVRSAFQPRAALVLENLALRQQLSVLLERQPRPRPRPVDRIFWAAFSQLSSHWRNSLALFAPATVVRWHRAGWRLLWRWRSRRPKLGRPPIAPDLRRLVREMAVANPTWGAPRIHGELLKLGYDIAESTVAKYLPKPTASGPSPTWKTFLRLHLHEAAGMDFFSIPTAAFGNLYGFVVIRHRDRKLLRLAVTDHPTAEWTKRQLVEAFPYDSVS